MKDKNKELFSQLLPLYHSDEFNLRLETLMPNSSKAQQLLIKMEIRRLMSPCAKPVDLRGKVAGECRSYIFQGITHWLDDVALNLYYQRINIYQKKMTLGLWEELHQTPNNYRILRQHPPSSTTEPTRLEIKPIQFGHVLSRTERRIQLSSPILVYLANGIEVHGSTLDISNMGMRVKLPASFDYEIDSLLTIFFPDLSDECHLPELLSGLEYRILSIEFNIVNDNFARLRLALIDKTDVIEDVISMKMAQYANKTRIDNEDKVFTLRNQSYEHIFLAQSSSLPLFFKEQTLSFCLLTKKNKPLWDYWHDERNLLVIHHLLSAKRMLQLTSKKSTHKQMLIYCFAHYHNDKTYFFSASSNELSLKLRPLFWHIGSPRASWKVLRVTLSAIDPQSIEQLLQSSDKDISSIKQLTHIVTLEDLTFAHANEDFRLTKKPSLLSKELNQFLHPRSLIDSEQPINAVLHTQRKELRYKHKTQAKLKHPKVTEQEGETIDLSPHGLQLTFTTPLKITKGQTVDISFTHLQRLDANAPLSNIPYNVVRLNEQRKQLTLSLIKNRQSEIRSQYLRRLIDHNQKRLQLDTEYLPEPALVKAMQQLVLTRLVGISYFLSKNNDNLQLACIGINSLNSPLASLLQKDCAKGWMSLHSIFGENINKYANLVTRSHNKQQQVLHEFYLAITLKENAISDIKWQSFDDFNCTKDRIDFILQAQKKGRFIAIRNLMQPIYHCHQIIDHRLLSEIMSQSVTKASQIENEFAKLCVYGQLHDITDEVLLRFEQQLKSKLIADDTLSFKALSD